MCGVDTVQRIQRPTNLQRTVAASHPLYERLHLGRPFNGGVGGVLADTVVGTCAATGELNPYQRAISIVGRTLEVSPPNLPTPTYELPTFSNAHRLRVDWCRASRSMTTSLFPRLASVTSRPRTRAFSPSSLTTDPATHSGTSPACACVRAMSATAHAPRHTTSRNATHRTA